MHLIKKWKRALQKKQSYKWRPVSLTLEHDSEAAVAVHDL